MPFHLEYEEREIWRQEKAYYSWALLLMLLIYKVVIKHYENTIF